MPLELNATMRNVTGSYISEILFSDHTDNTQQLLPVLSYFYHKTHSISSVLRIQKNFFKSDIYIS